MELRLEASDASFIMDLRLQVTKQSTWKKEEIVDNKYIKHICRWLASKEQPTRMKESWALEVAILEFG